MSGNINLNGLEQVATAHNVNVPIAAVASNPEKKEAVQLANVVPTATELKPIAGIINSLPKQQMVTYTYEGNIEINCSIPPNVTIRVYNGNVTIHGDVGRGSNIILEQRSTRVSMSSSITSMIFSAKKSAAPAPTYNLTIHGALKENVTLDVIVTATEFSSSTQITAAGYVVCGDIGAGSKIRAAYITAADVGKNAILILGVDPKSTPHQFVRVGNVATEAHIEAYRGRVYAKVVKTGAVISTAHELITAEYVERGAILKSTNFIFDHWEQYIPKGETGTRMCLRP